MRPRAEAKLTHAGQLSVSSRFRTDLPDQLKEALKQGVPLHFNLSWQLSAPSVASYKFKFDQLLNNDSTIQYKLSFHPLTNPAIALPSVRFLPSTTRLKPPCAQWARLRIGRFCPRAR